MSQVFPKVKLIGFIPDPESQIINAAAESHQSTPTEGLLQRLIEAGHLTPLEFGVFNFRIEGVSRAFSHQFVRRRTGVGFVQLSQRYVKIEEDFDYVIPPSIAAIPECRDRFIQRMKDIANDYHFYCNFGIPYEDARFELPNATETKLSVTINYHALFEIAWHRLCNRAQWEILKVVNLMKDEIYNISPKLASFLQPKCYWLGYCPEIKGCGKTMKKKEILELAELAKRIGESLESYLSIKVKKM